MTLFEFFHFYKFLLKTKRKKMKNRKKMIDGKSFEFNFPITVASRIACAIEIIMKNNEE